VTETCLSTGSGSMKILVR